MTKQESERLIKVLKESSRKINTREEALNSLVRAGIATKTGQLRKQYRTPKK